MALRELVDGDCGGRNPMLKVASHFTQDQGFRQDLAIPQRQPDSRPEDVMVREFLEGIPPPPSRVGSKAFHMGSLLQDLRDLEKHDGAQHRFPIQPGPNVAAHVLDSNNWAEDFLNKETHVIPGDIPSASSWSQEFLDQPSFMGAGANYEAEWDTQWNSLTSHIDNPVDQTTDLLKQTAGKVAQSMSAPKFAQSEFMQKVSRGEETLESTTETAGATAAFGNSNWADEFTGAEANGVILQPGSSADIDWTAEFTGQQPDLAEQWSQEFTGNSSAEVFRSDPPLQDDFWSQLQRDWDKAADENPSSLGWLKEAPFDSSNEYSFETENPYKDLSDPFNEGLQKKAEGDIPSAILLFEAALQKDPDHMKAWELLGLSLAENEQDPGAITAYKRCLVLEPSNLVAIMGLAVSYTNESYQLQACQALEDWLRSNPKYAHLASTPTSRVDDHDRSFTSLISGDTFNRVQDMYMKAARLQPSIDLDPDVQTGLGVLLNLSGEFDKAPDCFRAALQMKPNDSLLWNRLGATLANGGRSEEAVEAYYKALELSPGFIRARYNLAVSCINLGVHKEAAEHLVSALQIQARRSKRVTSDNIWSTLRMVLNLMNKREFIPDIDARDLTRLVAEFGTTTP
nr:EOG090X054E [Eurycercus lamellatus]